MSQYTKQAKRALGYASYDPRKLILLHTGIVSVLSLVLIVLDYLIGEKIGSTGGLSGMGTRAMLTTIRTVLGDAQRILIPFWNAGYFYAMLRISRGEPAAPGSLLQGFRSFGAVLVMTILQALIYLGITILVSIVVIQILSFTPMMAPAMELVQPYLATGAVSLDVETAAAITQAVMPMTIAAAIIAIAVLFIFSYRYRMAIFRVMDAPKEGGRAALWVSKHLMRGNKIRLFRLDLSFWWYYLLTALLLVIAYGDLILGFFGIAMPWNDTVSYFVFYILYLICQLALDVAVKNSVTVSYGMFYNTLLTESNP